MSVYIEIGNANNPTIALVTRFGAVTKLFGSSSEVQVSYDPGMAPRGMSDCIRLPFSYNDFRRLFQEAAKNNEILDVREENWKNLRQKLAAGTQENRHTARRQVS